MNMKKYNLLFPLLVVLGSVHADSVPYQEDVYAMNAPEDVQNLVAEVAQQAGFTGVYQVVSPKKAGIEINPWNKFIGAVINPSNGLPLVVVSSEWLNTFDREQQKAYVMSQMIKFIHGFVHPWAKYVVIFYLLCLFVIALVLAVIGKRLLPGRPRWQYIAGISLCCFVFNIFFALSIQTRMIAYLNSKHEVELYKKTIKLGINQELLIKSLMDYDAAIQQEVQAGEIFWKPYEGLFARYANALK